MAQVELYEVDVEVEAHGDDALLVSDGTNTGWVPYSLIDEESEITRKSVVGAAGTLVLPEWKAVELGLA